MLLNNEHFIGYTGIGFYLTNYRLIIADSLLGMPSIPLTDIVKYEKTDAGLLIEFLLNGVPITKTYKEWLKVEIVMVAKAKYSENHNEIQRELLSKSNSALQKENPELILHVDTEQEMKSYIEDAIINNKLIEDNSTVKAVKKSPSNSNSWSSWKGLVYTGVPFIILFVWGFFKFNSCVNGSDYEVKTEGNTVVSSFLYTENKYRGYYTEAATDMAKQFFRLAKDHSSATTIKIILKVDLSEFQDKYGNSQSGTRDIGIIEEPISEVLQSNSEDAYTLSMWKTFEGLIYLKKSTPIWK